MKNIRIKDFDFDILPEVYQIETTNHCQLNCWMCGREWMKRKLGYLNPNLIDLMTNRRDFDSSYMVELQGYGEPTLHPQLPVIIDKLHSAGVKVGMSTNAVNMARHFQTLQKLDFLTISMDAYTEETYNKIRRPSDPNIFVNIQSDVDAFLKLEHRPFVDIQCVVLPENKDEIENVFNRYKDRPNSLVRTVEECFVGARDESAQLKTHRPCLNPWLSVSVLWNGDVVPCCFFYDTHPFKDKTVSFTYGNLWQKPLREVWQDVHAEAMRSSHLENVLFDRCQECRYRSPALLHWRMMMNWLG